MKPRPAPEALLAKHLTAVQRAFAAALRRDTEGVHQLRVTTRRLREALPVAAVGDADAPARKARKAARRMTRALRSVRELDVSLQLLDELARAKAAPALAIGRVRSALSAERHREWRKVLDNPKRISPDRLAKRLHRTTDALQKAPSAEWRVNLSKRLATRADLLKRALDQAGSVYSRPQLHRVRLSTKKLRYAFEVAAELGGGRHLLPSQRRLKKVQESLGDLHDRAVLADHVRDVASLIKEKEPATARVLEGLAGSLDNQCRRLHAKFVAAQPALRVIVRLAEKLARLVRRRDGVSRMAKAPLKIVTRREKVG